MTETVDLGLDGPLLVVPAKHEDDRGFFSEVYNHRTFSDLGLDDTFVQDNHSMSATVGTIRGLHFQIPPHPVAKLVRVTKGAIWDVVVDLRPNSKTYGSHAGAEISASNWKQIYVPVGFAHGFCTLEPDTEVAYKVTDYWSPEVDKGVAWDDPSLAIEWPSVADASTLSAKDQEQPKLVDLPDYFGGMS